MTAAYTALYDDVLPELPGCEPTLALHHIKRACNDFYERSLYARETLAGINVVAQTATYAVAPTDATNFQVGKILRAQLFGFVGDTNPVTLDPKTPAELDLILPQWATASGSPRYYTQTAIDSMTLALVPATSTTGGLVVTIAKLPQYAGTGIDSAIYDKFGEEIAKGAKARLMRMKKKPWSDPEQAQVYQEMFDKEISAAAVIAARAYGRGRLRTRAWG
jgi:hypothetical protein